MTYRNKRCRSRSWIGIPLALLLLGSAGPGLALESDRQQPLEVYADDTDGSLGDGMTVLSGRVEIRQGTLHIEASRAEVEKSDGKVQVIRFLGQPATLEQEIEEQGLVQAEANTITYQVGAGVVELAGAADVTHPQYQISGELLTYDLDRQHFEGTGSTGDPTDPDNRIRIQLEPEVAADLQGEASPAAPEGDGSDPAATEAADEDGKTVPDTDGKADSDDGAENNPDDGSG